MDAEKRLLKPGDRIDVPLHGRGIVLMANEGAGLAVDIDWHPESTPATRLAESVQLAPPSMAEIVGE